MFLLAEGKIGLLLRQQRNKFAHEAAAFFLGLLGHDQFSDDAFRRFSWYDGPCLCAPDLAPWPALILKLGSVEQETDDEEEPV